MTYFIATIKDFFYKRPQAAHDPVYKFFFETNAKNRKKVYIKALKKAQADQDMVSKMAKEKVRV